MIKFRIKLTDSERATLTDWVTKGRHLAKKIQKAQVLLASDQTGGRQSQRQVALAYHLSERSVERIRKAFFEEGMGIFEKKERKTRSDKKIDGRVEAHLVALACSAPPEGHARWKRELLADKLVELQLISSISATAVGTTLKKRTTAFAGKNMGDSAQTQRRFRLQDGTGAGRL